MKYLKIIIFILVILVTLMAIKYTAPIRELKRMEEYVNQEAEERHSRNEYFIYEKGIM